MKIFVILAMIALGIYTFWSVVKEVEYARDAFDAQNTRKGMQIVGEVLLSVVVFAAGTLLITAIW